MSKQSYEVAGSVNYLPSSTGSYTSTDQLSEEDKQVKKLIERRHPNYTKDYLQWKFFESTYHGGRDWFDENIFKYCKEGNQEYQERVDRAYRFNHSREIVDLINKYLFKQQIHRKEDAPECVSKFWKHATKYGGDINDLAKQISKNTSIFGRIGIVVDNAQFDTNVFSVKEEKESKFHPYAYIVTPTQMLDYSFDEDGNLNWILIQEVIRDDDDPFTSSGDELYKYRLWTKEEWYEFKEDDKSNVHLTDQGKHGLGVVPVVLADNLLTDEEYGSPSMLNDIAYLDRATANYLSNLDAIIQDQTFSQLIIPMSGISPDSEASAKLLELGTKRIFTYLNDGTSHAPQFISPDPKQAQLILDVVNRIVHEIYHTVGLSSERTNKDNAVSKDNSSGVAKAYDFERVNALLASKADSLEVIENKLAKIVCLWCGKEHEECDGENRLVLYPDNFDTRGLYDEFDIASRLMLIDAPGALRREQMSSVVDKLFPLLKDEIRKKIDKELEDWPITFDDLANQNPLTMRTASNNLRDPTNTIYKTGKSNSGKGDATKEANGSKVDKKQPEATKRQGQVTKNTGNNDWWY